jgi:acetyl-CoA carboxylase biotin carboxyl carrier protein
MNEQFILALIDKFISGRMAELDFSDGTSRLVLRNSSAFAGRPSPAGENAVPGETGPEGVHLGLPAQNPQGSAEGEAITSPIVASFYAAPSPDAPAFVKAGSKIKAGDTLCILEAMKMMNHLEAEFDCEIIKVHASSGELVEYGQTLFTVKRL